jgi:hypothetical protein
MPYWWDEGQPNRPKGLAVGLVGGIAGMAAMLLYWRHVAPHLFPADTLTQPPDLPDALNNIAIAGKQYRAGESAPDVFARVILRGVTGIEPSRQQKVLLSDIGVWLFGMMLGGIYGGTRTTTAPLDPPGGLFYGMRIWFGDTIGTALLGMRPGPGAIPLREHAMRLTAYIVYSAVTANVTRLLYKFVESDEQR